MRFPCHMVRLGCLALATILGCAQMPSVIEQNATMVAILRQNISSMEPLQLKDILGASYEDVEAAGSVISLPDTVTTTLAGSPRMRRTAGILLSTMKAYSQAEQRLREADGTPLSRLALAITLARTGRMTEAHSVLGNVKNAAVMLAINGEAAYWAGDPVTAEGLLELAVRMDHADALLKSSTYEHLAYLNARNGDVESAIRFAQLWNTHQPSRLESYTTLAGYYLRVKRTIDARETLDQVELLGGRNLPDFAMLLAQVYDQLGNLSLAIRNYEEALRRNPEEPYTNWYLGYAYFRAGNIEQAKPLLVKVSISANDDLRTAALAILNTIKEEDQTRDQH